MSVYSSLPFSELKPIQQEKQVDDIIARHKAFNPTGQDKHSPSPRFGPKVSIAAGKLQKARIVSKMTILNMILTTVVPK